MTRLSRPVTRLVETSHGPMNVTLTADGISFRAFRSRTSLLLPYGTAIVKAAMLKADQTRAKRKKRVSRGSLTRGR